MKAGFFLVLIGFGGMLWNSIELKHIYENGDITKIIVNSDQGVLVDGILKFIGIVGFLLIIGEVTNIVRRRRKVLNIVIEHIALSDKLASTLSQTINKLEGRSEFLPNNNNWLRQFFRMKTN